MSIQFVTEGAPAVLRMSAEDKLGEAIRRSRQYMPAEVWESVKELLSPQSLRIMAVVTLAWAISHFFGVGEIADVVLLAAGALVIGASISKLAADALAFAKLVRNAETEQELDEAGKLFAGMVVLAGVTAISAMFMVKKPPVLKDRFFNGPWKSAAPRGPELFYRPTTTYKPLPPRIGGYTTAYGDIVINSTKPAWAQGEALLHEQLHQMLTPKLRFLRDVRVTMAMEGYNRSYLLRYLEEALAETYALVRSRGAGFALEGIKFPVKNGYVTIAKMGQEATGVMLGPLNIGGTANNVVYFYQGHSHGVSGSW